jgi:hypothetical protein
MKEEVLAGSALAILSPPVVRGSQANSKISVGLIGSGRRGSYDAAIARVPFARWGWAHRTHDSRQTIYILDGIRQSRPARKIVGRLYP